MAFFVRVKDSYGHENLINIDLITRIRPCNGGGAWLEFASEHQQDTLVNDEVYRKVLKEIDIAE